MMHVNNFTFILDGCFIPEMTEILLEPCSSFAILSASSISSIPKPCWEGKYRLMPILHDPCSEPHAIPLALKLFALLQTFHFYLSRNVQLRPKK